MATNYSLICWGGRVGKTCTISNASPAVVTLNNHGIRDNLAGKGVYFTTDGSLPTGITADTVYYARRNDNNTFHLYDTEAHAADTGSTTGIINTSSAGSGTHTVRGAYYKNLTTEQKARYGSSGSERIYDGIAAWKTARVAAGLSLYDTERCEIGESFLSYNTAAIAIDLACAAIIIETIVDGVRSDAYHNNSISTTALDSTGFCVYAAGGSFNAINITAPNVTIDGVFFVVQNSDMACVKTLRFGTVIKNCVFRGNRPAGASSQQGIMVSTPSCVCLFANNTLLEVGGGGFYTQADQGAGSVYYHNIAHDNNVGFYAEGANNRGFYYNNISIGNGTNWWTAPTSLEDGGYNAGETGNNPWGTSDFVLATTDFDDYTNHDFRPSGAASPQVGTGIVVYNDIAFDAAGKPRPQKISITQEFSYDNLSGSFDSWSIISWGTGGIGRLVEVTEDGTSGTMGIHLISGAAPTDNLEISGTAVSATALVNGVVTSGTRWVDSPGCSIGAFEYDYGTPADPTNITIEGLPSNVEVRVYRESDDVEIAGIEDTTGDWTFEHTETVGTLVRIVFVSTAYEYYSIDHYSLPAEDTIIPVQLRIDRNYNNPT